MTVKQNVFYLDEGVEDEGGDEGEEEDEGEEVVGLDAIYKDNLDVSMNLGKFDFSIIEILLLCRRKAKVKIMKGQEMTVTKI